MSPLEEFRVFQMESRDSGSENNQKRERSNAILYYKQIGLSVVDLREALRKGGICVTPQQYENKGVCGTSKDSVLSMSGLTQSNDRGDIHLTTALGDIE